MSIQTQTRAQRDLQLALELVRQVEQKDPKVRSIYGGLCHQFPVMVRTVGLLQTLAFHEVKARGKSEDSANVGAKTKKGQESRSAGTPKAQAQAHALLLDHVTKVLGLTAPTGLISEELAGFDTRRYMHDSRRVLGIWIYFKRFAVSVLKVSDGNAAKDGNS